jgi:hypothetical protein
MAFTNETDTRKIRYLNIVSHITTKKQTKPFKKHDVAWHSQMKPTCKFLGKLNPKSELARILSTDRKSKLLFILIKTSNNILNV